MLKYILSFLFIYIFIGIILYLSQRRLVFNRSGRPNKPNSYGLYSISEEHIRVTDSLQLLSWYSPPKTNKPTIIYFHGNSLDIGERAFRIKDYIEEGYGILLPAYRGYSGNRGNPTEKNLYHDAKIFINWLKNTRSTDDYNIILYGESLGTGIAVHISQNINYKAIILEAPFTSLPDIAKKMYPIYPFKTLVRDKFDNLSKINNLISPVLFIHGKKDEIVPFKMGKKLYNLYKKEKDYVFVDEALHNNLYDYGIVNNIIEFINKH